MPKTLRVEQSNAVRDLVSAFRGTRPPIQLGNGGFFEFPAQRAVVGYGGVGCGKTLIGAHVALEMGQNKVLVVVPPCGGVVFQQWQDEFDQLGCGAKTLLYHGTGRTTQLAEWTLMADAAPDVVHILITSINTLHADALTIERSRRAAAPGGSSPKISGKKQARSAEQWKAAVSTAVAAMGTFGFCILDEFHEFRNGSPPTDEKQDIDPTKAHYVVLDAITARSRPFVLGLSATPIMNTPGELFSFLRLGHTSGMHEQELKLSMLERSRTSMEKNTKRMFKESTMRIAQLNVIRIASPVGVPPTSYEVVSHSYTPEETLILEHVYSQLREISNQFLAALIQFFATPENPAVRARRDYLKNRFLSKLTHCKRVTLSPHSFAEPPKRAEDPFKDPHYDKNGNIVMVSDGGGGEVPLGRLLPFDVPKSFTKVPIEKISKFRSLIDELSKTTNRRSMIVCEFTDPIDLLFLYIMKAFPGRAVYKFHGKVAKRDRALKAFQSGPCDGILLASRGACGMAVNIESTTTDEDGSRHPVVQYQLDMPMSQGHQDQTEGRIKRPLAQGYPDDPNKVETWLVKQVLAASDKPTVEDWCAEVMKIKHMRCMDVFANADELQTDGREESTLEIEEGSVGPLKMLTEMLAEYIQENTQSKKRHSQPTSASVPRKMAKTTGVVRALTLA
jgi:hypothetical protein